jgi:hypothetical protein
LAELETIDTFSCSYTLEHIENSTEDGIEYAKYELKLYP